MAKTTIKVGDTVRVVRSRIIKRVGYPLVFTDLRKEFNEHPRLEEALRLLGVMGDSNACAGFARRDAVDGLAKAAVRFRGWGGRERRIHYFKTETPGENHLLDADTIADCTGREVEVLAKKTRMTGDYYPPWSGRSYEGEYDLEPGGLANMKAHVILTTSIGDIEACDVEPVS